MTNSTITTTTLITKTTMENPEDDLWETCNATYTQLHVVLGIFMLFMGLIAVTGNVVICIVIIINKHLHNVQYILLLSLAFVDLLISSILLPYNAVGSITFDNEEYIYSPFWVVFGNALWYTLESLSIMSLLLVSIERFIAIRYPFKHIYLSTPKNTAAGIVFVWLFNLVTFLLMYFLQEWPEEGYYDFHVPKWLEWTVLGLNIFLSSGLNVLIYIYVLKVVSNQRKRIRSLHGESSHQPLNSKSVKLFSYVMISFLICWIPFFTFQVYLFAQPKYTYTCTGDFIDTFLAHVTFVNSVGNAFIYGASNKDFKNAYKRLFKCKCTQTSIEPIR